MLSESISLSIREKCCHLPQKLQMKITHNNARVLSRHTRISDGYDCYYVQELPIKCTSQKTAKNFTNNEVSFMVALRPQASSGWTAAWKSQWSLQTNTQKGKQLRSLGCYQSMQAWQGNQHKMRINTEAFIPSLLCEADPRYICCF